jgi:hypothetical protein
MAAIPEDPSHFMTIAELLSSCEMPGRCGTAARCEGTTVRAKGFIDHDNVFDKRTYPRLPYEKFKMHDGRGNAVEVWAVAKDNREIFQEIARQRPSPQKMVHVKGEVVGFDMPIMGECRRGIRIDISGPEQLFFR